MLDRAVGALVGVLSGLVLLLTGVVAGALSIVAIVGLGLIGALLVSYLEPGLPAGATGPGSARQPPAPGHTPGDDERPRASPRAVPPLVLSEGRSDSPPTAMVLWAHRGGGSDAEAQEWKRAVLRFVRLLRECGVDADVDLYHEHESIDWARALQRAIKDGRFVVIAVSPAWRRAWDDGDPASGPGAVGEANVLHGEFRQDPQRFRERVVPVVLPGRSEDDLPSGLRATENWVSVAELTTTGIEGLLRRLTRQPRYPPPPLGQVPPLPPDH